MESAVHSSETASNSPVEIASQIIQNTFRRAFEAPVITRPKHSVIGVREVFVLYLGIEPVRMIDLGTVPGGEIGARIMALRYLIANGPTWLARFGWRAAITNAVTGHHQKQGVPDKLLSAAVEQTLKSVENVVRFFEDEKVLFRARVPDTDRWLEQFFGLPLEHFAAIQSHDLARTLIVLEVYPKLRGQARQALCLRAPALIASNPALLDALYLATQDLERFPATTVSALTLKHLIVADKGEMGVRAVREAIRLGLSPVILYSQQDDATSLQVRLTKSVGGLVVPLAGNFRESYANYVQIAQKVKVVYQQEFGDDWWEELSRSAIYPGYGPLAENAAAIKHFRQQGLIFVGPMQDVVEMVGDKRQFRRIAEKLDPHAVTPGIVLNTDDPTEILSRVEEGYRSGHFGFPGRIKAANGGGGRGQVIVLGQDALTNAIQKVMSEIKNNGWDPGVMFEQNIAETTHLEVQVMRDRYGNARHFGMRDCTEQRASQKIQEEAPPAILQPIPEVRQTIEQLAVQIADSVGYVGAGTVELMFKGGKFYFLEMNTRIQVEHPVTEESHAIRREDGECEALNLVQWQIKIANGYPIDFQQDQVVKMGVAREFRINAEAWNPLLKDSRDGRFGLFVPNGGIFDAIEVPTGDDIKEAMAHVEGIRHIGIRFDAGFEPGDKLINKDPTFGKLIISVQHDHHKHPYELLRLVCIEALKRVNIVGRQVRPDGKVLDETPFSTNVRDHIQILESEMMKRHSFGDNSDRHVNWVVNALRSLMPQP